MADSMKIKCPVHKQPENEFWCLHTDSLKNTTAKHLVSEDQMSKISISLPVNIHATGILTYCQAELPIGCSLSWGDWTWTHTRTHSHTHTHTRSYAQATCTMCIHKLIHINHLLHDPRLSILVCLLCVDRKCADPIFPALLLLVFQIAHTNSKPLWTIEKWSAARTEPDVG